MGRKGSDPTEKDGCAEHFSDRKGLSPASTALHLPLPSPSSPKYSHFMQVQHPTRALAHHP